MPEYGSESQTLCIYACICIWKACKKCLLMKLDVMKIIEVNLIVVLIFYSFNNVLSVLEFTKYLCEWIGLLSDYHNMDKTTTLSHYRHFAEQDRSSWRLQDRVITI